MSSNLSVFNKGQPSFSSTTPKIALLKIKVEELEPEKQNKESSESAYIIPPKESSSALQKVKSHVEDLLKNLPKAQKVANEKPMEFTYSGGLVSILRNMQAIQDRVDNGMLKKEHMELRSKLVELNVEVAKLSAEKEISELEKRELIDTNKQLEKGIAEKEKEKEKFQEENLKQQVAISKLTARISQLESDLEQAKLLLAPRSRL
ncbi:MAG: hypothetical protein HYZ47_01900 [Simkania negevensis]|nr:hypothetical protein [Simkania negevensis]